MKQCRVLGTIANVVQNGVSIKAWGNSILAIEDDQGKIVLIEHPADATEFKTSQVFSSANMALPPSCGQRAADTAENQMVVLTCEGIMTVMSHH